MMLANLRAGRILRVNLTDGKIESEPTASYAERFVGGKAIDAKILFDEVEPDTKPFDPENLLLFGAGPLLGTPFPGASRVDVMAKCPVTGAFGDSGMGGYLGAEMKFAGYDNLVIEGKAERPVYLSIRDDRVEIRDASAFWGQDTYETPALVREQGTGTQGLALVQPLRQSLSVFEGLGARSYADRARRLLCGLKASPHSQRRTGLKGSGLSEREIEIARLAAEGLTAGQIADRLFARQRTVKTYGEYLHSPRYQLPSGSHPIRSRDWPGLPHRKYVVVGWSNTIFIGFSSVSPNAKLNLLTRYHANDARKGPIPFRVEKLVHSTTSRYKERKNEPS